TMPCSPRICEMRASDSGTLVFSAATSCLISARIAVEEAAPPASVATWLPKKYFSSKVPRGVAMYFCVVTREMALSLDDRLGHPQDGFEALLHVLDEPARLLQLRRKRAAATRAGGDLGVQ